MQEKINQAFCPEKQVNGNPVLEICKYVIFPDLHGDIFLIKRPEKFGGDLKFTSYNELEKAFINGVHPLDLKNATAQYVNKILEPINTYFKKYPGNYQKMKEKEIIK